VVRRLDTWPTYHVMGIHCTIAGMPWIVMPTIASWERALMPRGERNAMAGQAA
jgi:hypothetical protein